MRGSRLLGGAFLAWSATGCFATKGDIRLLQEEIRAARVSAAQADSARRRTSDSLAAALANLTRVQALAARDAQQAQQRNTDELKALKASDITTREQLKAINVDLDQLHELTRQNARGQALARAQLDQANAARQQVMAAPDTTTAAAATPTPSGPPGSATLLVQGRSLIIQGSCATARRNFQDILNLYPDSPEAPEALYSIAESYVQCGDGNPARADSVYRLVIEKYPKSDFAPMSYYKRAEALRQDGKMAEARPLYEKIVCEYPRSTLLAQAINRLGNQRPSCR